MNAELFDQLPPDPPHAFAPGAWRLPAFARDCVTDLLQDIEGITAQAPFRHMHTPGGHRMSVAMSNCGALGWVSDETGYRYSPTDPPSGQPWPAIPQTWLELATQAATAAGFPGFTADACLINQYLPGARMSLHQDRNELDLAWPIVSVSLGLPVIFQFGGLRRTDPTQRLPLGHGDVLVWGGPARLAFHGVLSLKPGQHPLLGARRINLTFRRAG